MVFFPLTKNCYEDIITHGQLNDFSDFIEQVSGQKFQLLPQESGVKQILCKLGTM